MNVLVFKTSVPDQRVARSVAPALDTLAGEGKWNFALDDRDKILRITTPVPPELAIFVMNELGFECNELED